MDYETAERLCPLLSMPDDGDMVSFTDDGFAEDNIPAVACQDKLISALYVKAGIVPEKELAKRVFYPECGMTDLSVTETVLCHGTDACELTCMCRDYDEQLLRTEHYVWELHEMICAAVVLRYFICDWEKSVTEEELRSMASTAGLILQGEESDEFTDRVCTLVRYLILLRKYDMRIPEQELAPFKEPGSFGFHLSYASYADTILNVLKKDLKITSDECFAWILPEVLAYSMIPFGMNEEASSMTRGIRDCSSELAVFFSSKMGEFLSWERSGLPETGCEKVMHDAIWYVRNMFSLEEDAFGAYTADCVSKDGF